MVSCESKQEIDTSRRSLYYFIKPGTALNINNATNDNQIVANSSGKTMSTEQLPVGLEALSEVVAATFAGYSTEVASSLGIACLGLNCTHRLHQLASVVPAVSLSASSSRTAGELMRPPKGLILFGPPGTGKTSLMHGIVAALGCNCVELSHSVLLSR